MAGVTASPIIQAAPLRGKTSVWANCTRNQSAKTTQMLSGKRNL
eukprot:CAMPEP_0116122844 /NCGR_PEP_ID=MMETSP0329-20121206/4429_1 /TAXON_ID=697910 /ORGANISM="Pseudo-nitzschia arenysensis, Strain B593" /LENGTH=43 /DNA_ID= /DNA_START= /DNA_END= /DNA_ORIENTATION=